MNLANPSALAWAALAVPILLLYMLKIRRKEVVVSSTYLWQRIVLDRLANTPWQRIQRNFLLFLQLGILLALVIALSRPVLNRPAVASGSLIVLLDASASMQARDVPPTRFDAAVSMALEMVNTMQPGNSMTLILVNAHPEIIAVKESDKSSLISGLKATQVSSAEADWPTAMALAAGAYRSAGPGTTTIILSDGGLGPTSLLPYPGKINYLPIGSSSENIGITAMAVRSAASDSQLLTKVTNYGLEDRTALLSIYRNNELFQATQVKIAAGKTHLEFLVGLPDEDARFTAHISNPEADTSSLDWLELDDWGFASHRRAKTGNILLVTGGNFFLEQLLAAIPGITAYRALGDDLTAIPASEIEDFDLIILDRTYVNLPQAGNLLLIDPPENDLFRVSGYFEPRPETGSVADHPLTRFVRWDEVHIRSAAMVDAPEWADILVASGDNPLVFAGQKGRQRIAVLTFDVLNSDLTLQTSFPILFANLVSYLIPGPHADLPESLPVGTSFGLLPLERLEAATVRSPSGVGIWPQASDSQDKLPIFEMPGHHTISYQDGGSITNVSLAVNVFSNWEGNIDPASAIIIGSEAIQPLGSNQTGQYEIWWLFALIAIMLLIVEWWIYHKGEINLRSLFIPTPNR